MNLKLMSSENLTQGGVGLIPWKWQVVRDTKASSEYIFQGRIHTSHTSVYVNIGK